MNTNINLNKICIEHCVFPRGITNPSLEQVIQAFEERLNELQLSPARKCGPSSGDYIEWKQRTDALQSQLVELRKLQQVGRPATAVILGAPTSAPTTPNHQSTIDRTKDVVPPQSQISNLKSKIEKHPDFPPSPTSSRQNSSNKTTAPKVGRGVPTAPPSVRSTSQNQSPIERTQNNPQVPSPAANSSNEKCSMLNNQCSMTPFPQSEISNLKSQIPTLTLARVLQSAAARKSRPDDKIAALSDDDRQQLLDWLNNMSYDAVVELAAQPRPQGLDLQTSRAALNRFYQKHDLNDRLQTAIDILESAAPTPGSPTTNTITNPLEQTLELLVHAQATRVASQPINDRALPQFLRHITRLRELQQRERAITLRQKALAFRMQTQGYDITAETMKILPQLNEIAANKNITPRQAFAQAFIQTFGQQTHDYIQEANRKYAEQHPGEPNYGPTPDESCLQPELDYTDTFRLLNEFPDTPMPQIRAIAAERKRAVTQTSESAVSQASEPACLSPSPKHSHIPTAIGRDVHTTPPSANETNDNPPTPDPSAANSLAWSKLLNTQSVFNKLTSEEP